MTPRPQTRQVREELSDAAVVSRSWGMALATLVSRITGLEIATVAALVVVAAGAWFFWDRWRKKRAARKAL